MTIAGGRVSKCLGVFSCIFSHIGRTESDSAALWVEQWAVKVRGSACTQCCISLTHCFYLQLNRVGPASQTSTCTCMLRVFVRHVTRRLGRFIDVRQQETRRPFSDKTNFSDSFLYLRSVRLNRSFICDVISLSLFFLFCSNLVTKQVSPRGSSARECLPSDKAAFVTVIVWSEIFISVCVWLLRTPKSQLAIVSANDQKKKREQALLSPSTNYLVEPSKNC